MDNNPRHGEPNLPQAALLDPTIEIQSEQNSELMFSPSPGKRLTTSSVHEEPPSPGFKLTLAVKPWATSKVRVLEFLLTQDSITQSNLGQPQDVDLFRLNSLNESTEIKSLHIEDLSDEGHLRLRAILATKVEDIISSKEGTTELQTEVRTKLDCHHVSSICTQTVKSLYVCRTSTWNQTLHRAIE
jgi:hypothetical protein